jgi:hypothetical protein
MSAPLAGQVNTTAGTAAGLAWGQRVLTSVGPGVTSLWYAIQPTVGRSYCAETGNVESGIAADRFHDTVLDVFGVDATTLVKSADDTEEEPLNSNYSRACWIATASGGVVNYILIRLSRPTLPRPVNS